MEALQNRGDLPDKIPNVLPSQAPTPPRKGRTAGQKIASILLILFILWIAISILTIGRPRETNQDCTKGHLFSIDYCEGSETEGWMNSGTYFSIAKGNVDQKFCASLDTHISELDSVVAKRCAPWKEVACSTKEGGEAWSCLACEQISRNGNAHYHLIAATSPDCIRGVFYSGSNDSSESYVDKMGLNIDLSSTSSAPAIVGSKSLEFSEKHTYIYDSQYPHAYDSSAVTIASGFKDINVLAYAINTSMRGGSHGEIKEGVAYITGRAYRLESEPSVFEDQSPYVPNGDNSFVDAAATPRLITNKCIVRIKVRNDEQLLTYEVVDAPNAHSGCSMFTSPGGKFLNNEQHILDGKRLWASLGDLDYSKEDIAQFDRLIPSSTRVAEGLGQGVQVEPQYGSAFGTITFKLQNDGDMHEPQMGGDVISGFLERNGIDCKDDINSQSGDCNYSAFLKDTQENYYVMKGSNHSSFTYNTTNLEFKLKLPSLFIKELERMHVSQDKVLMPKN